MSDIGLIFLGSISFTLCIWVMERLLGRSIRTLKSVTSISFTLVTYFWIAVDYGSIYHSLFLMLGYIVVALVFWSNLYFVRNTARTYLYYILTPIIFLGLLKISSPILLIGSSYALFRIVSIGFEVLANQTKRPNFIDYLGYVYCPITMYIGPINRYQQHEKWLSIDDDTTVDDTQIQMRFSDNLYRFSLGLFKVFVLALPLQIAYQTIFQNDGLSFVPYLIAGAYMFTVYLYLNFSGMNDTSIALGGMIKMPVDENFNQPFLQTNVQAYWEHWHMTLSNLARNVVFTPLTMSLGRFVRKKPEYSKSRKIWTVSVVPLLCTFILIGLWHGVSLQMFLFGLLNGFGVVFVVLTRPHQPDWWVAFSGTEVGKYTLRFGTLTYMCLCNLLLVV